MLNYLKLRNVGPAPELELELGPRINLITGDNGLGKSFLLDIAWWALTRTWSALPVRPMPTNTTASISFRVKGKVKENEYTSTFNRQDQAWIGKAGRPINPELVLYAQADGGFSVWDPARNYWKKKGNIDVQDRPPAYFFDPKAIWNGLKVGENTLCRGLLIDWDTWQKENGEAFTQFKAILSQLSPAPDEKLLPGKPTRISLDNVDNIPTLQMPYGQEVPVLHASAGMKRIIALGYLLVWAWQEHQRASELLGQSVTRRIIFLIDEIEAHLHPRWQRVIMGSLLKVMDVLTSSAGTQVQLVCATHSPLLLASVEPLFDEETDRLIHLSLDDGVVELSDMLWAKHGDTTDWLTSDVFGLKQARSLEAERAIGAANAFMRGDLDVLPKDLDTKEKIHAELKRVLAGDDTFWPRWVVSAKVHLKGKA